MLIAVAGLGAVGLLSFLWFGTCLVFRRRFQYSLRTLLLFVLLVNIVMAWFGANWRAAGQQRDAVAAIKALGGSVRYDYVPPGTVTGPTTSPFAAPPGAVSPLAVPALAATAPTVPPGPAWARRLLGDDFFANVVDVCGPATVGLFGILHPIALRQSAGFGVVLRGRATRNHGHLAGAHRKTVRAGGVGS